MPFVPMAHQNKPIGRVTFASGEQMEYLDGETYPTAIREELPDMATTGFRYETLTDDPTIRKAVDDILLGFAGEENPRRECNYGLTEKGIGVTKDGIATVDLVHTQDSEQRFFEDYQKMNSFQYVAAAGHGGGQEIRPHQRCHNDRPGLQHRLLPCGQRHNR